MKSVLLLTTALVPMIGAATLAPAQAQTKVAPIQVTVGGYWGEFIGYSDQRDFPTAAPIAGTKGKLTRVDEYSDKEIHFNGRTTLDNGLTIGFRLELEGNTDATDQIDESWMFIEGRLGRVELGALNNVQYRMGYNAPEAQSRSFANAEGNVFILMFNNTGSPAFDSLLGTTRSRFFDNDSEKVNYYTPRFEGFQFGVSYIPNSSQDRNGAPEFTSVAYSRGVAVGANYVRTFGAFDVAASAGYMRWQGPQLSAANGGGEADDPYQYNFGLQLGYAGFKAGGSYGRIVSGRAGASGFAGTATTAGQSALRLKGEGYDGGVMYTFGPAAVSVTYLHGENNDNPVASASDGKDKFSVLSLAGKYTLGPGVSLEAAAFHAKLKANSSGGVPNTSNEANGGIVGLVLAF